MLCNQKISVNTEVHVIPNVSGHRHNFLHLTHIIHGPKGSEARSKISPDEVIVTVRVAGVLLRGVVSTGVGGILWGKFLLTLINF